MLFESALNDEEQVFLAEVRTFLATELDPALVDDDDEQRMFFGEHQRSNRWVEKLKQRGWQAAHWPRDYGGAGFSAIQNYIWLYEQGRAGAPFVRPFGYNYVGPTVMKFGTQEQKASLLPDILEHRTHWCQGFSETGSGSDLGSVATFAEKRGDAYVVNGHKIWTTDAQYADKIFCLVRTSKTDSKKALSFVLIDMHAPGVEVQPIRLMAGDHELNQVFFDDVEVLPEQVLGEIGDGWAVARFLLEIERGAFVFGGRLRRRFEHVVARARRQGASARFRQEAAQIEVSLLAYEASELRLAHLVSGREDPAAANIIKIEWTEIIQRIDELGLSIASVDDLYASRPAGDALYDADGEIAMPGWLASYFNNRATTIYGGSNEIQRNLIYRTLRPGTG